MVEVHENVNRSYYLLGYGREVTYSIPLTSLVGPSTIIAVPQYGQFTSNQLILINPNTTNVVVRILDGDQLIFSTVVPAGQQIIIDTKLNFLTGVVIIPTGQILVYGSGVMYIPPNF